MAILVHKLISISEILKSPDHKNKQKKIRCLIYLSTFLQNFRMFIQHSTDLTEYTFCLFVCLFVWHDQQQAVQALTLKL